MHVSRRAAVLAAVLLILSLTYADRLRVYLAQQAEIHRLEADQKAQRERIQQLTDEVNKWNDPEYVAQQARDRLQLVHVGEQVYLVGVDPAAGGSTTPATPKPWYEQVWSSVQTADDPPTP